MSLIDQPLVYGIVVGLPSFLLGFLAYRRSKKVDAISAQSGAITEARAGVAQVIDGLNKLVERLQEDNEQFRTDLKYLTGRLDTIITERDALRVQLDAVLHGRVDKDPNGP